jgi:hypothetical protein
MNFRVWYTVCLSSGPLPVQLFDICLPSTSDDAKRKSLFIPIYLATRTIFPPGTSHLSTQHDSSMPHLLEDVLLSILAVEPHRYNEPQITVMSSTRVPQMQPDLVQSESDGAAL